MSYYLALTGAIKRGDIKAVVYAASVTCKLPMPEDDDWLGYQYVIRAASIKAHELYSEKLREFEDARAAKEAYVAAWDICVARRGGR